MKGLKFKNKKAGTFGSHGWSGEGVKLLSTKLSEAGFEVVDEGVRVLWAPDALGAGACREYGKAFAASVTQVV